MIAAEFLVHGDTRRENIQRTQKQMFHTCVMHCTIRYRRPTVKEARIVGALIFWIIVGLVAGALAKFIMPGDDPGGFVITIILGIAGAMVGGFLASLICIGGGGVFLAPPFPTHRPAL